MNSLFLQNNVSQRVSESELQDAKRILLAEINKKPSQTDIEALKVSLSKTIDQLPPPCPTNDFQFKIINNRCVYFEKTSLDYDKAIENCKEKLKDYGGGGILYEPNSIAEQKRIVDMAYEHSFGSNWAWIGVTDKTTEGQFTYNSNNQPINFTPDWHGSSGSRGRSHNCIMMYVTSPSGSYHSEQNKWYDYICTDTRRSICWSIN